MTDRRIQKEPLVDIDTEAFLAAIRDRAARDNVSLHSVAWTLNISMSTFTRIGYSVTEVAPDYRPNLRTYLTLCWWMDVEPSAFMVAPEDVPFYVTPPVRPRHSPTLAP